MKREPVVSTVLKSVGYDPATATLELEFVEGGVYQYLGVPGTIHVGLLAAESHGAYFQVNVKAGGYRYVRIV